MIDLGTFPLPPFDQRKENAIELACWHCLPHDERYEARQNMTGKELTTARFPNGLVWA